MKKLKFHTTEEVFEKAAKTAAFQKGYLKESKKIKEACPQKKIRVK